MLAVTFEGHLGGKHVGFAPPMVCEYDIGVLLVCLYLALYLFYCEFVFVFFSLF